MTGIEYVKGNGIRSIYKIVPPIGNSWHIKISPAEDAVNVKTEATKISWAKDKLPVPSRALAVAFPGVSLLLTRTLNGRPSFEQVDIFKPDKLVDYLLEAGRKFRAVSPDYCSFEAPEWTFETGIVKNLGKLATNKQKHRELHPDFSELTLNELKDIVDAGPQGRGDILCHGDWCMPNVLLGSDGQLTGIVDLGGMHIGNENLDPAIMSWTIRANMGENWEDQYLSSYNLKKDDQSISYQRLIYDLGLEHKDPWGWVDAPELVEQRALLVQGVQQ